MNLSRRLRARFTRPVVTVKDVFPDIAVRYENR